MIFEIINVEQGSDDWFNARLGKWTASNFSKLITLTRKPSTQANTHNNVLVAENILGYKAESFTSEAMERGSELEEEALEFINFTRNASFKKVGFIDSGNGYGCSPDALDEKNRIGLEIKCPLAHNHLQNLLRGEIPTQYYAQVQGSMLVTGYEKWIFCSYHPEIKSMVLEIERDEAFIDKLKSLLDKNCKIVTEQTEKLRSILNA